MDLQTKLRYLSNHIDSIARHVEATVEDRLAVLERVAKYATDAKATAEAAKHMPAKIAVATDEAALRAKIADVQAQMAKETDPERLEFLRGIERTFGAMLPPVTAHLNVGAVAASLKAGS